MLVEASQGVEAQTVANLYLAMEYELELVPVINKIDLPAADIDRVSEEIDADLGLDPFEAIQCSAKNNIGIDGVLEAIVERLPSPGGDPEAPLKALVFDAQYDKYRGVVMLVRVEDGVIRKGQSIRLMYTEADHVVEEVGYLKLEKVATGTLETGSVGYVIAGIKTIQDINIGDTMTETERPAKEPIPGYREAKPVVYSSIYPMSSEDYGDLTKALDKLKLNDAALTFTKVSSAALGFGFRCGFLGLLHLDSVQERLEREFGMSRLLSAPPSLTAACSSSASSASGTEHWRPTVSGTQKSTATAASSDSTSPMRFGSKYGYVRSSSVSKAPPMVVAGSAR